MPRFDGIPSLIFVNAEVEILSLVISRVACGLANWGLQDHVAASSSEAAAGRSSEWSRSECFFFGGGEKSIRSDEVTTMPMTYKWFWESTWKQMSGILNVIRAYKRWFPFWKASSSKPSLVRVLCLTRWWFQKFFLFSPLLGEDYHFD